MVYDRRIDRHVYAFTVKGVKSAVDLLGQELRVGSWILNFL